MHRLCFAAAVLVVTVLLAGCTTSQRYALTHDRLVQAAYSAITQEAYVKLEQITREDTEEQGGRLTVLKAPYLEYSKIEAMIDSRGEDAKTPRLKVKITTGDFAYSRHKDMEERLQEVALRDLRARQHGDESKPTALPPAAAPAPAEAKKETKTETKAETRKE